MSFAALKKNRSSSIDKLVAEAEKLNSKKSYGDDRFWTPTVDKAGNGFAVIRFLPAGEGDSVPWVQYWDHGFQGPTGRWYIENSLTSIGQDDPVSEANSVLWNTGREEDKELARKRKRRLHYVSNIEVITDSANPANEGKVFLFKYGKKIFDKAMDVMQPQFEDEEPINPYDFWDGADFKLKIRQVEGYRNYDKSEFAKKSEHRNGDDKQLEAIYKSLYKLADFTDPSKYKSYADLKKKFLQVIGEEERAGGMSNAEQVELNETRQQRSPGKTAAEPELPSSGDSDDDSDSELGYFEKLAAGEA